MHTLSPRLLLGAAVLLLGASAARADMLLDSGLQTFLATGQQWSRISRNSIPSDWSGPKTFPGLAAAGTQRGYELFTVNSGIYPFLQIEVDDPTTSVSTAAYLGSFQPVNAGPNYGLDVNYLGDMGFSGNPSLGVPGFFQIQVPVHQLIVIALTDPSVSGSAGNGKPFQLWVEGFLDTGYTNAVPEPGAVLLFGAAGLALAFRCARKRSA